MSETFIFPLIRREDYEAFQRDLGPDLANSYDEWAKLCASEIAEARLQGKNVVLAPVNFEHFTRYCLENGKKPDPQILLDFAISTKPEAEA